MAANPKLETAQPDDAGGVMLDRVLDNLARELAGAIALCVGVEEIVADRLIDGSAQDASARVELQNIDRLIQMLTDFRSLAEHLGRTVTPQRLDEAACHPHLIMEELRQRLLSAVPVQGHADGPPTPDISFF